MWRYLLLFVILTPFVYAQVDVTFEREVYSAGETVQARIVPSNLVDGISLNKISLFKDGMKIPVASNLNIISNKTYYLFFILPSNLENGNYSLDFGELLYYEEELLKRDRFSKNLTIVNKGTVLSVYPAYVKLDLEYWERPKIGIKLSSLNKNVVSIDNTSYLYAGKNKVTINEGDSYNLLIYLNKDAYNLNKIEDNLIIKYNNYSYTIPFVINRKSKDILVVEKPIQDVEEDTSVKGLGFIESEESINRTLKKDIIIKGPLRFKNFGDAVLHDVDFSFTGNLGEIIRIEYKDLDFLNPGDVRSVFLYINERGNINRSYSGSLRVITREGVGTDFPIYLNFQEGVKVIQEQDIDIISNLTDISEVKEEKDNFWRNFLIFSVIVIFIIIAYFIYKKSKTPEIKFSDLFR